MSDSATFKFGKISRRDVIKSGGLLSIAGFANVSIAQTQSGNIELNATTSIPSGDYGIDVRIFEDLDGDNNSENQQSISLDDGTNTFEYAALEGETASGIQYWMDVTLSGDGNDTPVVNSLEIVLPESSTTETPTDGQTWTDTFEDGNIDGWNGDNISISNFSTEGEYSLEALDGVGSVENFPTWQEGPVIDLNQPFTLTGVSHIDHGNESARSAFGLIDDLGNGVMLIFSAEFGVTFLGTSGTENYESSFDNYDTEFGDTWVNWIIDSTGNGVVQAKVWEVGTDEPTGYDLSRDFTTQSGNFRIWTGTNNHNRVVNLDEIEIQGEIFIPDDDGIIFDTRTFVVNGETIPYTVEYRQNSGNWIRVTDDANIQSQNENIIEVDESNNELVGVGRGTAIVTASYNNRETGKEISSGEISVGDLELLPLSRKIQAIFQDRVSQVIFASTFAGLAMSKIINSGGFGAGRASDKNTWITLGTAFMIIVLAGVQEWVSIGIVFAALFFVILASMFIQQRNSNDVNVINQGGNE